MPLSIKNPTSLQITSLLEFVKSQHLNFDIISDDKEGLPGKPLSAIELENLISESDNSGILNIKEAHQYLRNM
jgi:hypothetical protein